MQSEQMHTPLGGDLNVFLLALVQNNIAKYRFS